MRPLAQKFYERNTLKVARDLLGSFLVFKAGGLKKIGLINETEAYCGEEDLACHASHGRTQRTEIMYQKGGYWYVYLIYGKYFCLNIVTEKKNLPAAVLIRGVKPILNLKNPCDGPGKLCREFGITRNENGTKAFGKSSYLYIVSNKVRGKIITAPRIGVNYAGAYKDYPWRFCLKTE
jgi:DNA-3-methyladenine glycosylase